MSRAIPPDPPRILEHHVRLPDQAADLLGATALHARGITGRDVRVAVIDSGFYPHPYYVSRGYRITRVPTQREPEPHIDEYGHGTAQLASLFALAPAAEVLAIKCLARDPSNSVELALSLKPQILSCAWGFNIDHPDSRRLPRSYQRLQSLIRQAVANGVTVVAAGGNGQGAFPGCMPEVISAGGVYYAPNGRFYPSDISSKFESALFPGRKVPDICGLVGNRPHGRLLLVPVPPRARLARRRSLATTAAEGMGELSREPRFTGYAMFSGTSAATAMVAGACALLLEKDPRLTPAGLKRVLMASARLIPSSGCLLLDLSNNA